MESRLPEVCHCRSPDALPLAYKPQAQAANPPVPSLNLCLTLAPRLILSSSASFACTQHHVKGQW